MIPLKGDIRLSEPGRPARDTDALAERLEVAEKRLSRIEQILVEKGFDFA